MACETFCLDDDDTLLEATMSLQADSLSSQTVRFVPSKNENTASALSRCHNKKVYSSKLIRRTNLHGEKSSRSTMLLEFESNVAYQPGDHFGVYPQNRPELVDKVVDRLKGVDDLDEPIELQVLKETHTSNGVLKSWIPHERLPACSIRTMLARFLDITTPPTPNLLQHFASIATTLQDQQKLDLLATDSAAYEDWRHWRYPNLAEVLEEFPSVIPYAPLLIAQLSILQPRFYSISSSSLLHPNEVHLTVAVVVYKTEDGNGPTHYGVCSNYLQEVPVGEEVCHFVRGAPNFHLPSDPMKPIILVGPGTGIAPFRAFWQHRLALQRQKKESGKIWLFFGCRTSELDLYKDEKNDMLGKKVLHKVFLALSRESNVKKTYVQDIALKEAAEIYRLLVLEKGHFYVCGDCTMAEHVYQTLKCIIQKYSTLNEKQVEDYMLSLRVSY